MLYIFLSDIITIFHVLLHKDYKKRFPKRLSLRLYTFFCFSTLHSIFLPQSTYFIYPCVEHFCCLRVQSDILYVVLSGSPYAFWKNNIYRSRSGVSPHPSPLPHSDLVWFANSSSRTKRAIERKLDEGKTGNFIYIHVYSSNRMKEGTDEMK